MSFDFRPDAARARALDAQMRGHLADSFVYLASCLCNRDKTRADLLERLALGIKQGLVYPPSTFGLYYEIASALIREDVTGAALLIDELGNERPVPTLSISVRTLDEVEPRTRRERYQRLMDTDSQTPFLILSPTVAQADADRQRLIAGWRRLNALLPELGDEFEALVREVVLVIGDPTLGYEFAGGSCYMLWGALFINADSHPNDISMIEALAHESAHSLLFGFTIDEPLVLNDASERFVSPLRDDPRPMDGIFHATFVSARMHWAMKHLSESPGVDLDEVAQATSRAQVHSRNFWKGLDLVHSHAALSSTGRSLMNFATEYMSAFPA